MAQDFYVIIEKDEDGYLVGEVPSLKGCYSQGKTLEELLKNIREVIEMCQPGHRKRPFAQNTQRH